MATLGFIGTGNMASAIYNGIVSKRILPANEIGVYDINAVKLADFAQKGSIVHATAQEVVKNCHYVVLSVKPQNYEELLKELATVAKPETVFISIAAGMTAPYIKSCLGYDAKVVVVMPNTPMLIGYGTVAMSNASPTTDEEFAYVMSIFGAAGEVAEIPADKMNEVIPFNGSSPAFIYRIAQIFVNNAVELGFDADTANKLFCSTLIGSARMMLDTGKTHQELIDMVTSPGGTTIRGLNAMNEHGLEEALRAGIEDCIKRAYELGK